MKKRICLFLSCILLFSVLMPMTVIAAEETEPTTEELWSEEYYRIMDTTDSLSQTEIDYLDGICLDLMRTYHMDLAIAAIPEERLYGETMETFAKELYEDCGFGYGPEKNGFLCLYLEDTEVLTVVPMGEAAGILPQNYLDFMEERIPTLRENNGVYGVFVGCQELLKTGLNTMEEKRQEAAAEMTPLPQPGSFERYGEGADMPSWFPVDLEEAHPYQDAAVPRVVDYADVIPDETEIVLEKRIAEIREEQGKDIVIVTDVSNYGLGDDIYAADFYDYNGYGIGPDFEGILLFLDMNPNDRGGWTCETGPVTRDLYTYSVANRIDDFLYDTLATGDYARALCEWVEDVYDVYTKGIPRAPFWYPEGGMVPDGFIDPYAPTVVDEWNLLSEQEITALETEAAQIREIYGVPVYYHTTGDRLGMGREQYHKIYVASMGYPKDCVLLTIENTNGDTVKYFDTYTFGTAKDRIPEKFRSRIENNASSARDSYGRLFAGTKLLKSYLKNGRVPRNAFYWSLVVFAASCAGAIPAGVSLSKAESDMRTVNKQTSAYSYLNSEKSFVKQVEKRLLYMTTRRKYIAPRDTTTRSSGSGGHSTYRSSYSGHSGTSHTGHGRKF